MEASQEITGILNDPITVDEVSKSIRGLKTGKAVSEDLIANEFLKSSNDSIIEVITKLFNDCLNLGVYPWNVSIVTPLHKKGNIYDPNNYRAIAVGSNLGKLFSSVLLKRLLEFRETYCPDPINQLGFCKGAQTADHIFTLTTCIDKYVKHKKERLFTCFVDFQKAFDTVWRDALLYKLWHDLGVDGKFFKCLTHMYSHGKAKLKLVQKISQLMDVEVGTEQGHPMSPELFKCYILRLSTLLNDMGDIRVPELNGIRLTHLLWADDLVLLALDRKSLQLMMDKLHEFCSEWGLSVNITKTAVLVFNRSGRLLKESHGFTYGNTIIPTAKSYCYLGITFSLTGSFKTAQGILRQKGLRAYFSLKRLIDISAVSRWAAFRLFDALILPVVSYGCQVWLPTTSALDILSSSTAERHSLLGNISKDPLEALHLSFLKWSIGVNKRTSNAAVWGDSGRGPLAITLLKQLIDYRNRLEKLDGSDSPALVRAAFVEQKKLNLPWISKVKGILRTCGSAPLSQDGTIQIPHFDSPSRIRANATKIFEGIWDKERHLNRKLGFYNSVKSVFQLEPYLKKTTYSQCKRTAQLRTSSHKLGVETGRHGKPWHHRACGFCSTSDKDVLQGIAALPFCDLIIEDELHVLRVCPKYHAIRSMLPDAIKTALFTDVPSLFDQDLARRVSQYVEQIFKVRFPKNPTAITVANQ